jgi:cyclophilin family peptidyl-prolyl cis-trans isomerase
MNTLTRLTPWTLVALVLGLSVAYLASNQAHSAGWVKIIQPPGQNAQPGLPTDTATVSPPTPDANVIYPNGALLKTTRGDILIELFSKHAPNTVRNFQQLVARGFYNGLVFHRVVPGFVVQTGDPTGTGSGGSEATIKLEVNQHLSHTGKGIVAMARKTEPHSASSQFYITLAAAPSLDGKYAVFGRVIQGLDVLDSITPTDRVVELTLQPLDGQARDKNAPPMDTVGYQIKKLIRPGKATQSAKGGLQTKTP